MARIALPCLYYARMCNNGSLITSTISMGSTLMWFDGGSIGLPAWYVCCFDLLLDVLLSYIPTACGVLAKTVFIEVMQRCKHAWCWIAQA